MKPTPCSDWVLKLSARHPDDLSTADHIALAEHLEICQACSEVYAAYQTMEIGIRSLLSNKTESLISYQPMRLDRKPALESGHTLTGLITLVFSAFSSLLFTISWSSFYHKLHTWILIFSAHYPRKVTYVHSNNNHTFAIRSDSGFFLWQQKRYLRHNHLHTIPVRIAV